MEHDDRHRVKEMLEERSEQIAEERTVDGVGRSLGESVAQVTAASRRLGADQPPDKAEPAS